MAFKNFMQFFVNKKNESTPQNAQENNQSNPSDNQATPSEDQATPSEDIEKEKCNATSINPEDVKEPTAYGAPVLYNLIILDESGSMSGVTSQTISGCNETLNGIRTIAKEDPEIKQFVSIYCFDTSNSRYLFKNVPIEKVRDLTWEDYRPNACTPLYDAIGLTVSQLMKIATDTDAIAKVTIITDGYENASRHWNHSSVVELIESLKKKGWLFTFMGANIDVERTSRSLGIDSCMEFKQTDEGMKEMFACERRSQRAYAKKMSFMRHLDFFENASVEDRAEMLSSMNVNYFTEDKRVTPNAIVQLKPNEIFVFGSNVHGVHDGGAAAYALKHFGAVMGQAEGIQGQSYAIPTAGNTFEELKEAVRRFTEYAVRHPKQKFMLTSIGCGAAGYTPEQIAPLFKDAYEFGNVYVPASFLPYVDSEKGTAY